MRDDARGPRRLVLAGLAALAALYLQPVWSEPTVAEASSRVTTTLTIEGQVTDPQVVLPETLAALPSAADPGDIPVVGNDGAVRRVLHGYRGVRLVDLLPVTRIRAADHNALKRTYLAATASDGYVALFSWGELYNSAAGSGVWILFSKDGHLLGDEEGRFTLISTHDTRTGPRHVRWLKTLAVVQLPAP